MAQIKNPLTIVQQGGGGLDNYGSITYLDSNNVEQTLTLVTEDDFLELCNAGSSSSILHLNNVAVTKDKITSVTIADGVTYLPDYFMYLCSNLTTVDIPNSIIFIGSNFCGSTRVNSYINLDNVKSIGANFLTYRSATSTYPIVMPSVEYIGSNFLYNNTNFNGTVSINDNCKIIGSGFMQACWNFAQDITIPSGLEDIGEANPGANFMNECREFTGPLTCNGPSSITTIPSDNNSLATTRSDKPLYATGVTIKGTYASQWKSALPDRGSSPYRKLIVGS